MTPPPSDRNSALDFTKGTLVALMVVYHWGNYFLGTIPYFYDLLRFLTASFIFLSGATISMISAAKYGLGDNRLHRRMGVRGFKLVALFTLLNLVIHALALQRNRGGAVGLAAFFGELYDVYVTGNSFSSSFRVLLSIGYLLFFSVVLLRIVQRGPSLVLGISLLIAAALQFAEITGWICTNPVLLSFGFFGLALHWVGFERINRAAARLPVVAALYAVYLGLMLAFGPLYWVQLLGVSLNLLLIYGVGLRVSAAGVAGQVFIVLGRYSLLGYVAQIAILQVLVLAARRLLPTAVGAGAALAAALVLTVALVFAVEFARKRSAPVDWLYRLVFA